MIALQKLLNCIILNPKAVSTLRYQKKKKSYSTSNQDIYHAFATFI